MINFVWFFLRDLSFHVLGKCNCSNPLAQDPARLTRPYLVIQSVHVILDIRIILIIFLVLKLIVQSPLKTQFNIFVFLVSDQRDAQFFIMYLFSYLTVYMFRAHRAHHQERQIVSTQPLVTAGGRVVCRSEVHFRTAHDTATDSKPSDSYQRLY
jgi:hypothetical protein